MQTVKYKLLGVTVLTKEIQNAEPSFEQLNKVVTETLLRIVKSTNIQEPTKEAAKERAFVNLDDLNSL